MSHIQQNYPPEKLSASALHQLFTTDDIAYCTCKKSKDELVNKD